MIPSMMLVLGSVLHKGPGSAKMPVRVILGVLGVRQIVIPLLGECKTFASHVARLMTGTNAHFVLLLHHVALVVKTAPLPGAC